MGSNPTVGSQCVVMAKRVFKHSGIWFVVLLLGVLLALWWGLGFAEQARQQQLENEEIERILDERGEARDDVAEDTADDVSGEEPVIGRAATIAAVEAQAATLLPGTADADDISRFWFFSDTEVYVEYTVAGEVQMAYLENTDGGLDRVAHYAQSVSGTWELLDGEEVLFTKPLRDLYERDSKGNWVARN